jgi:hypothetical protein
MALVCGSSPGMATISRRGFRWRWLQWLRCQPVRSGEAIVTNDRGLAVFDLIRHKRHGADAMLLAFDLIELDGEDLRWYANRAP